MLLRLNLLYPILQLNFLPVEGEEFIANHLLFTLYLGLDLSIGHLDGVALDEAVASDCHHLLVTLHPVVVVEKFHNWVVMAILLLRQFDTADDVTAPMLPHLNRAIVEADSKAHLVTDGEI